jgi:hypothetical protein
MRNRTILFLGVGLLGFCGFNLLGAAVVQSFRNDTDYLLYVINQTGQVISGKPIGAHEGLPTAVDIPAYSDSLIPGLQISGVGADSSKSFDAGDIISLSPLRSKGFGYLNEEFADGQVTVVFQAKDVSGDVQVAISSNLSPEPDYTIIIGGQNNSKSSILKNGIEKAFVKRADNPIAMAGILPTQDPKSYPQYWICYDKGLIIVGKGTIGDNVFLCWRDSDWNPSVRRVGFGSGVTSIKYASMFLLPSLDTVAPQSFYQTITAQKNSAKEKINFTDEIKFGGVIKLKHKGSGKFLKASGSIITCSDEGSYWVVRVPNKPVIFNFGINVKKGMPISLESLESGKILSGPSGAITLSEKYSSADDFKVDFSQAGNWLKNMEIRLLNVAGNLSAEGKNVAFKGKDDIWVIESYDPPLTNDILPTGSIIALKNSESDNYLNIRKKIAGGNLKYEENVVLKNIKFIQKGTEQPVEKKYYLIASSGLKVVESSIGQWSIKSAEGKSGEIKYRDVVTLYYSSEKLISRGLSQADQWMILDPNDVTNDKPIKKGSAIALKSIADLSYIGCSSEGTINFLNYVSDDEKWMLDAKAEEGILIPMAFVDGQNINFNSQFRVIRSSEWIGLQSLSFNQNLEVSTDADGSVKLGKNDFYFRKTEDKASHFLIRKVGEDFYLFSRLANCMVNNVDASKPLATKFAGRPAGYIDSAKFDLEIFSEPKIEIVNAEYSCVSNPDLVYDVTDALQSLVNGNQLVIPAGSDAKNLIFGDPANNLTKQLTFVYRSEGKEIEKTITEKDAFFVGMDKEFDQTGQVSSSLMGGEYFWLSKYPFRIASQGSVAFQAKAIDDIYIALASDTKPVFGTDTPIYEFKIGTENNTKVVLNKRSQKFRLANVSSPNIISQDGFNKYWISITNKGVILFGHGSLGENLMLAVQDNDLIKNIKYVGFSCGQKPVEIKDIAFAPSVNLDVPQRLTEEYKAKLRTYKESVRQLTIVARFGYFIYTRGNLGQVFVANEAKQEVPVAALDKKLVQTFSITINEAGTPILVPEGSTKASEYQTLETISTVVSSLGELAGSIGTAAGGEAVGAIAKGITEAGAKALQAGIDAAYAGASDVRTEEYKHSLAEVFTDAQVTSNNERIKQIESELKPLIPSVKEDFEQMIDLYSEMFLLLISDGNMNLARKKKILDGLENIILNYKKQPVRLYNNLIKMLLSAYNNPFLFGQTEADMSSKKTIYNSVNDIAKVMFKLVNEVEIPDLFGNYLWLEQEFAVDGNGAIKFDLATEKDAFFAFSAETGAIRDTQREISLYELIIGRYVKGAGSIAFRLSNKGILPQDAVVYPSNSEKALKAMPQLDRFKTYWYSIKTQGGTSILEFGVGAFKPENVVLSWQDSSPYKNVKYIGIGSWGTTPDEPSIRVHKIKNIAVSQKPLGDSDVKWVPICKQVTTVKPATTKTTATKTVEATA